MGTKPHGTTYGGGAGPDLLSTRVCAPALAASSGVAVDDVSEVGFRSSASSTSGNATNAVIRRPSTRRVALQHLFRHAQHQQDGFLLWAVKVAAGLCSIKACLPSRLSAPSSTGLASGSKKTSNSSSESPGERLAPALMRLNFVGMREATAHTAGKSCVGAPLPARVHARLTSYNSSRSYEPSRFLCSYVREPIHGGGIGIQFKEPSRFLCSYVREPSHGGGIGNNSFALSLCSFCTNMN